MRRAFRYICWNDEAHMGRHQVIYRDVRFRANDQYVLPDCPRCGKEMTFCGLWDLDTKEPIRIASRFVEAVK